MDQKQRDILHAKELAKGKKAKYIFIGLIVCLVILAVGLSSWLVYLKWAGNNKVEVKNEQKVAPIKKDVGTTMAYGVEIHNDCFAKLQSFIKDYGADYSKCLVDFDFTEEFCGGFDPATQGLSDVNIIVILDSSGSMSDKIGSQSKIDVAKSAVSDFLTNMPDGVNTGLVVYGQKGSNSFADKALSCKGIEEVVKLGKNNGNNIISAMNSFGARGWTPIAGALDFVKDIFKKEGVNDKDYLILVSDGAESCDGDALVAAENLKAEIPNLKLDVIGFTNDNSTEQSLQRVASAGNGSYLSAFNSTAISRALNKELLFIKKGCLSSTFFKTSARYNANYIDNLNCWLTASGKESDDFSKNIIDKSDDAECNSEMADVLKVRQNEFWYKKEDLATKNKAIYDKLESDFNGQMKALDTLLNKN